MHQAVHIMIPARIKFWNFVLCSWWHWHTTISDTFCIKLDIIEACQTFISDHQEVRIIPGLKILQSLQWMNESKWKIKICLFLFISFMRVTRILRRFSKSFDIQWLKSKDVLFKKAQICFLSSMLFVKGANMLYICQT